MKEKYVNGWFYYRGTNKTYFIKNGTVIKTIKGYYYEESKKDPGYFKYAIQTKECPV